MIFMLTYFKLYNKHKSLNYDNYIYPFAHTWNRKFEKNCTLKIS